MTPLQLRLEFVVEQGPRTSLFGTDLRTGRQAALHIDQRPWFEISAELRSGAATPVVFMADGLGLALTFDLGLEEQAA